MVFVFPFTDLQSGVYRQSLQFLSDRQVSFSSLLCYLHFLTICLAGVLHIIPPPSFANSIPSSFLKSIPPPPPPLPPTTASTFQHPNPPVVQFAPASFSNTRGQDQNAAAAVTESYTPPVYIPVKVPGMGLPGNNYGGAIVFI